MRDIKMTFGKARVPAHVRTHRSGKKIAVAPYDTTRPPGRGAKTVTAHTEREFLAMSATDRRKARAPKCQDGCRGAARSACACEPCAVHQSIQRWRRKDEQGLVHKALDRLDAFLKDKWRKAAGFFKSEEATTQDVADQRAEDTLGAGRAPGTVELADDLASARDLGPETDPPQVGFEELPWAAEDHASAPAQTVTGDSSEVQPEVDQLDAPVLDPLAKARLVQQGLQAEIEALDQKLSGQLDDADRGRLLEQHLDFLIKADALTGKIDQAEQMSFLAGRLKARS